MATVWRHLLNQCDMYRRGGEQEVSASKWEGLVEQKGLSRYAVVSIWHGAIRAQTVVNVSPSKQAWARSLLAGAE